MVLKISTLKGFLHDETGKIETVRFIEASKEIIEIIESFGKLFIIAMLDIRQKCEKILEHCQKDETSGKFLEDLILADNTKATHSWLLWLKRALEMMEKFFSLALSDEKFLEEKVDELEPYLTSAYDEVLKPFHGAKIQSNFSVSTFSF